jgi:hypothetical protein
MDNRRIKPARMSMDHPTSLHLNAATVSKGTAQAPTSWP